MHYSILLGRLIEHLNCVRGRKKIQKIVHILQKANAPFEEPFEYSFYGPYSEILKVELDSLQRAGVIREEPNGETYDFTPGEKISDLQIGRDFEWLQFAKILNAYAPRELEALSTFLFISEAGYASEQLKDKFNELKPQLQGYWDWAETAGRTLLSTRGDWQHLNRSFADIH